MSNADDAEDVVAEAYLLAARSFHLFDPSRAKFSTWVTSIAINCMNSYYRKQHATTPLDNVPIATISVDGGQTAVENIDAVSRLLSILDHEEREIVLLKYRDGKRNTEIAEDLDMNASTVSTKLARALSKMRAAANRANQ